jgi:hypothetical protein
MYSVHITDIAEEDMLFFTINEEEKIVTVIRFLYGHRDWKNIFEKYKKACMYPATLKSSSGRSRNGEKIE